MWVQQGPTCPFPGYPSDLMSFAPRHFLALSTALLLLGSAANLTACRSTEEKQALKIQELQQQAKDLNEKALVELEEYKLKHEPESLANAEKHLREALQFDPNLGPAHNNLGSVLFKQRKLYDAAWEFKTASKLMPGLAEPIGNLGQVQELAGHLEEAQKQYEEAHRLAPGNRVFIGDLARVQLRRGQRTPAVLESLRDIALNDPRPEWRAFAKGQVVRWLQEKKTVNGKQPQAEEKKP